MTFGPTATVERAARRLFDDSPLRVKTYFAGMRWEHVPEADRQQFRAEARSLLMAVGGLDVPHPDEPGGNDG